MPNRPRPVVLIILDGWGCSDAPDHNAIRAARTPFWDRLWSSAPHTRVDTSGDAVGLPSGQMGNSEVGHLNIGSGRVVYQELTRIGKAIADGSFYENPALTGAVDRAQSAGGAVHILGLLSPGGVHSHEDHIHAMVELAVRRGAKRVFVHAFLDGRDTPPRSAQASLEALAAVCSRTGIARIASICGRYFAMDRDRRWDRVQRAYELLASGSAPFQADDAPAALAAAYERDESDEFVQPTVVGKAAPISDGDAVVFMNFRADRARELTIAFTQDDFDGFERDQRPLPGDWVTLTEYHRDFDCPVAFGPAELENGLGEYVSGLGLRQLRIAETEKYAHVTFFFNGGREDEFPGEDRVLVPSPQVATYDLKPEMSAPELTDRLCEAIRSGQYDLVVCNYANPDMVGHTGVFDAAVKAVETIDACLARVAEALDDADGAMLITADHGNVEQMHDDETGQAHTAHTINLVPLVYYGKQAVEMNGEGVLSDIAPSLLVLMRLPQPPEMTGRALLRLK
ncbi:MAG: 2,3-bisphosphoglycerate-independent phosphoglycerate mutase [Xanthomonadaceae bacterium]|nr:2,3-bisphosphoglycerate-independent phosphoglycerate mutase [Xanthomonadaceae bacterium]